MFNLLTRAVRALGASSVVYYVCIIDKFYELHTLQTHFIFNQFYCNAMVTVLVTLKKL